MKKLFNYISRNYVNKYWVLTLDILASLFSTVVLLLFFDYYTVKPMEVNTFLIISGISVFCSLLSFVLTRTYCGIMRHSTLKEMWRVAAASILKGLLMLCLCFAADLYDDNVIFDKLLFLTFILIDIIFTTFSLILLRIIIINLYSILIKPEANGRKRVLVYGNDAESTGLFTLMQNETDSPYKCVGFIKPDDGKRDQRIAGANVAYVLNEDSFNYVMKKYSADAILFPSHAAARNEKDRILDYAVRAHKEILIKPAISYIQPGEPLVAPIREVRVEDLLGRDEVEINMKSIEHALSGRVVMVTGAAGSIGSQICREVLQMPIKSLILVDNAETPLHNMQLELSPKALNIPKEFVIADVRSYERIENVFAAYKPEIVFHAAAYKHVPMMEQNPCEAVNVNVAGTKNVADASVRHGVDKFVMISTDKAVNPANVMGASKRIAEMYVQSLSIAIAEGRIPGHTRFVTTRFGNVLGSNGSVIPLFREQIKKGGPVTLTHPDIIRYFMTIPEACKLVLEAAVLGKGEEIFVFDMGEPVKIMDLAKNMIKLAGLKVGEDIEIKITGLRPGEKLYEELLNAKENTLPTPNKKIFIAKVRKYPYEEVDRQIAELTQLSRKMLRQDTVAKMKVIVPEYKSCNSQYAKLDA